MSILFENLHHLQPRYYSIASSPLLNSNKCKIVFNIVDYNLEIPKKRMQGLCTSWLNDLVQTSLTLSVPLFPKSENTFELDISLSTPLIMIAAGTGIAPFMGYLSHLQHSKGSQGSLGIKTMLIYGHRHGFETPEDDSLYTPEIQGWLKSGILSHYYECLSRQETNQPCYVQDAILLYQKQLWEWIDKEKARIYVCGSVQMAKSVYTALISIVENEKEMTCVQAMEYWKENVFYKADIWG